MGTIAYQVSLYSYCSILQYKNLTTLSCWDDKLAVVKTEIIKLMRSVWSR